MPDRSGIRWNVSEDQRLPHADRLEMSGHRMSVLFNYSVADDRTLSHSMTVIGPSFRMPIAATSNQFCHTFTYADTPRLEVDGFPLKEKVREINFDGIWSAVSHAEPGLSVVRRVFPSTDDAAAYETLEVRNDGQSACTVFAMGGFSAEIEGLKGRYVYGSRISPKGPVAVAPGETVRFGIRCGMRFASQPEQDFDAFRECQARRRRVQELASQVVLETDVPEVDVAFLLSKIRVGESVYRTDGGLMHSPGCGKFYGGMWPNDQIEYVGPWFAMTGDRDEQDATLNALRWFMGKMTPEMKPLPGAINREGEGVWAEKERGDAAMFASGASAFVLNSGRRDWAERIFPGLEWSLEYCRRRLSVEGVVESDFDELEGRFPCGKANLCTSSICYEALRRSALVARSLGKEVQAKEWTARADALEAAVERHFGAEVHGWRTYRYFEGCDKLRAWAAIPISVGMRGRERGTFDALFSVRLWTGAEMLTEEGNPTVWDRSLLSAFRGFAAAGLGAETWEKLRGYVRHRFYGDHVPYPIEQNMFRNGAHSAAEGALFCRIFTEGFFGLEATGFGSFVARGRLPQGVTKMSLKNVHAFGRVFDVVLRENSSDLRFLPMQ